MKIRARATDATHSEIKTQVERRRQQSKEIKEWDIQTQEASRWVNFSKIKEEQNQYGAHLDKLKTKHTHTKKMTQGRTRCCLSHIFNWSATNPAVVTR